MTTVTLELPDELAGRLTGVEQLPELLALALDLRQTKTGNLLSTASVVEEVLDFLASGPSPKAIVDYKISPSAQARLEELLDKNREGQLTPQEMNELDTYQQINHLLILLKARARTSQSSV